MAGNKPPDGLSFSAEPDDVQTLHRSIFLPFTGFTRDPPPIRARKEKVQTIVKNVEAQQAAVRGNMVSLALQKSAELRSKAEAELGHLDEWLEDEEERTAREEEQEELVQFLRFPAREGAERQDYETKAREKGEIRPAGRERRATNGETSTSGTVTTRRPRSAPKELASALRDLIDATTHELEAYDALSASTLSPYTESLSRRASRDGESPDREPRVRFSMPPHRPLLSTTAPGTTPLTHPPAIPGILKRKALGVHSPGNATSPVDLVRRMANGMPVAGMTGTKAAEPERTVESIEDLARRA
ncbi:unnamed protein product [Diplocarpon coronariae]|nr:hypothetical protein JHW43_000703 [Diplocarpon mali]